MKKKVINLKSENLDSFNKKIWSLKISRKFGKMIFVKYKGKEYNKNTLNTPEELNIILNIVELLNIIDKRKRRDLAYDLACDYLDKRFICENLCGFKYNMCESNRLKEKEKQVMSCCTSNRKKQNCEYFNEETKRCKIKCISCKMYTCPYLYFKKKIRFNANSIPYIKYFFSIRQKFILRTSFFMTKEEILAKVNRFYELF